MAASVHRLARLTADPAAAPPAVAWANLRGRLCELSAPAATGTLTAALMLVRDAQLNGEPAAWVAARSDGFYPPDASDAGVDLAALALVQTADADQAAWAADRLLRSGGFGLVALDLPPRTRIAPALMARLLQLAQAHAAAVLLLTEKHADEDSLGSLISLRLSVRRTGVDGENWQLELQAIKDKRHGPGWRHDDVRRGPDGLY